jgi:amino acid transporter
MKDSGGTTNEHSGFIRLLRKYDLLWMCFVATVSLNLLPSLAATNGILSLFAIVTVAFVIPQAVAVLEVSRSFPGEGGMVDWANEYFGHRVAFSSTYCYWVNNVLYVPTLIVFVADILVSLVGVVDYPVIPLCLSLTLQLAVAGLGILGLGASRRIVNMGGACTLLTMLFLVVIASLQSGERSPLPTAEKLLVMDYTSLMFFGAICMGMIGSELGTVVGEELEETSQSVAWATWRVLVSAGACYLIGGVALQSIMPTGEIDGDAGLLDNIMRTNLANNFPFVPVVLGGLLSVSVIAASVAWFDAGSRTLWRAAQSNWVHKSMGLLHPRFRTPVRASIVQALASCLVIVLCYSGNRGENVYQFLLSISVVFQLVPFVIMFVGLIKSGAEAGPRYRWLYRSCGVLGASSCVAGIAVSFIPVGTSESSGLYVAKLALGVIVFAIVGAFVYLTRLRPENAG